MQPQLLDSRVVLLPETVARHELKKLCEVDGASKELGYEAIFVELGVFSVEFVIVQGSLMICVSVKRRYVIG